MESVAKENGVKEMDRVDLLGENGAVFVVEHRGRKWKMSRMLGRLKAEFELWIRMQELTKLKELRDGLPEGEYLKESGAYRQRLEDGDFAFESDHGRRQMETAAGRVGPVGNAFGEFHPDMTRDELIDLMVHC